MKTTLTIQGENFLLNGEPVYSEIPGSDPRMHGLLMNARFIQGIFDDKVDPSRFSRFGMRFDPESNTDGFIAALPQWYRYGLRAFTVGLQGGGPCFTIPNDQIENNPFSPDGREIAPAYLRRLKKILDAADALGMVVIVSALYCGQVRFLKNNDAARDAVLAAARWLRGGGWRNVIFEPANEYDLRPFQNYPIVNTPRGMAELLDLARRESGLPVGCSGAGGTLHEEVVRASDVILFHGNSQSRRSMANLIATARKWGSGKPIVCNEDSQAVSNMQVCVDHHASWGYYNGLTKQELATDWGIVDGEDRFFALRMALALGIPCDVPSPDDQYKLKGISKNECWNGNCWPRLSSLYPEKIDYVDFFHDGKWLYRSYEDPFSLYAVGNWLQRNFPETEGVVRAEVVFPNGEKIVREGRIGE